MKKKIFKFFTAVSVLGATATLASCGGGETPTTAPTNPTGTSTTATSKPGETNSSEVYYCSAPEGDYLFTKTGSNFTLSLLGKTYSGDYHCNIYQSAKRHILPSWYIHQNLRQENQQ